MIAARASPLSLIGRAYVLESCPIIDPATISEMDDVISDYVSGAVQHAAARQRATDLIGTAQPIDKLMLILTVNDDPPDAPIPVRPRGPGHSRRKKTELWTEYEDIRLLAGIHRHGLEAWGSIARFVGTNRTKAQCCQRWSRGLDPRISKSPWSPADDEKLQALVAAYGQKSWTRIATEFGNRCDVQCRYRFNQLRQATAAAARNAKTEEEEPEKLQPRKTMLPSIHELIAHADSANCESSAQEPSPNDIGLSCMMGLTLGENVQAE
jgi:hypothetical protein